MAITTEFKFTNKTATTHKAVSLLNMGETSNYALIEDEPTVTKLSNKTAPVDQGEVITYRGKYIPTVNTDLRLPNGQKISSAVQYQIKLDADCVSTDSSDLTWRQDDPVVCYLTIMHPVSGYVTNAIVGEAVTRLISACQREDGTWRFDDLMRNALKPVSN